MFKLNQQGQQSFALAKNISKKSQHPVIESQDLVAAMINTTDTSAGAILFFRNVTPVDIRREIAAAQLVTVHVKDDLSLHYLGMRNEEPFENGVKKNPVPLIKEPSCHTVTIVDRDYQVSDYVLHGLRYGQDLNNQRTSTEIETQDILAGLVDTQDSNAFWLLLKVLMTRMHSFYADPYTNIVLSKLDNRWYKDGEELANQKQSRDIRHNLDHKLLDPDYSLLKEYGRDLTQLAREKKLSPVIGRDEEVQHLTLVLNRRQKANALLIGPAGVGKTAVVEGLAQRIAAGQAPALAAKRLIALDPDRFATLMAQAVGTEVISHLLAELIRRPDVILFIDEIQILRHRGTSGLFDMLKPALARGNVQLIGATTPLEAQDFFCQDEALARRFETITVKPLTRSQADAVVESASIPYENFYRANYTGAAKRLAVDLALTYLPTSLPDSALTILDNAGAQMAAQATGAPDSQDYIHQLHTLEDRLTTAKAKTLNDEAVDRLKSAIADLREKYATQKTNGDRQAYPTTITADDVIKATATILGRPLNKRAVQVAKQQRTAADRSIFDLEHQLRGHIIGQDKAIGELARALMVAKVGLRKPGAPIGTFFFAGVTGTGKTETAKQLAIAAFGSTKNLLRFNMPDFNGIAGQDLFVSSLVSQVMAHPQAVILLDEIEKVTPAIYSVLLSIMDDGNLLPNYQLNVDFSKTIIIMTSNIGAHQLVRQPVGFTGATGDSNLDSEATVRQAMQKRFAPEFLNRLTKVVVFNRLPAPALTRIANLLLEEKRRLLDEKDLHLTWDQSLPAYIIAHYTDPNAGARPLERGIDRTIMAPLAIKLLKHELTPGQTIKLSVTDEQLSIKVA